MKSQDENTENVNLYVNLTDGMRITGLRRGMFYYYVNHGQIKKGPGKAQFSRADCEQIAQERQSKRRRARASRSSIIFYDWIGARDIPLVLLLDQSRYTEEDTEWEVNYNAIADYQERYKKNPHIAMGAWSADRQQCLGYVSLYPIAESASLDILAGKRDETTLATTEIEDYSRPGAYTLHCLSMVCLPDHEQVLTGILNRYMEWWIEQYPTRFIVRVYAQTVSKYGIGVVRHLFLQPMAGYPDNAYYLDLARFNPSRVIQRFIERLKEKAPLPAELTQRYTPPLPARELQRLSPLALPANRPQSRTTEQIPGELTPGSISLKQLADELGLNRATVMEHLDKGHYLDTPIPSAGGLKKHFFTPRQAEIARDWHRRHGKSK